MRAIVLTEKDNVATAVENLSAGAEVRVSVGTKELVVKLVNAIQFGHKFALKGISQGGEVIKYGEVIGKAATDIAPGEHVHVHNVESQRGRGDLAVKGGGQ
jgi:altronate dehydratase small subunit